MNRTYRYPATVRAVALFAAMLSGGILLGSVIAEIEAADLLDAVVHAVGAVVGAAIVWLGMELGMRQITPTPDGVSTRLMRERTIGWNEVREARDGPLGILVIRFDRGWPIVVWPYLEHFADLLDVFRAQRVGSVAHARHDGPTD